MDMDLSTSGAARRDETRFKESRLVSSGRHPVSSRSRISVGNLVSFSSRLASRSSWVPSQIRRFRTIANHESRSRPSDRPDPTARPEPNVMLMYEPTDQSDGPTYPSLSSQQCNHESQDQVSLTQPKRNSRTDYGRWTGYNDTCTHLTLQLVSYTLMNEYWC